VAGPPTTAAVTTGRACPIIAGIPWQAGNRQVGSRPGGNGDFSSKRNPPANQPVVFLVVRPSVNTLATALD
jgi:hypothetical protein